MINAIAGFELAALGTARADLVKKENPQVRVLSLEEAATGKDIDVVVVATVDGLHFPLTELALQAGKHVVVEKPFTPSMAEAKRLIDLADGVGRPVTVFQNRRWDSDFLTVRRAIENGVVGEVVHFESHLDRFAPEVKATWREQPGPATGIWFDLGSHLVDQALLLFGCPKSVSLHLATQRDRARTDDWFHAVLGYGRRQVILHAAKLARGAASRFRVHGTGGTLVKPCADPQEAQLLRGIRPTEDDFGVDPDSAVFYGASAAAAEPFAAVRGNQCLFYVLLERAIRGECAYPVTHEEALAVISVLEVGLQSVSQRRTMFL